MGQLISNNNPLHDNNDLSVTYTNKLLILDKHIFSSYNSFLGYIFLANERKRNNGYEYTVVPNNHTVPPLNVITYYELLDNGCTTTTTVVNVNVDTKKTEKIEPSSVPLIRIRRKHGLMELTNILHRILDVANSLGNNEFINSTPIESIRHTITDCFAVDFSIVEDDVYGANEHTQPKLRTLQGIQNRGYTVK